MQPAVRNPRQKKVIVTVDDLDIRQVLKSLRIEIPDNQISEMEIITPFPKVITPHSTGGAYPKRSEPFEDADAFATWATEKGCVVRASGSSLIWEEVPRSAWIKMAQYSYSQFAW